MQPLPSPIVSTLANGLQVVTTEVPWAQRVCITLAVKVGSRDEAPGQGGIAHFAEHLAFRGSREHPSESELLEALRQIGAQTNASTSFDTTQFFLSVRPEFLPRALTILAGMVHQPLLNGFEVERRVVLSELRMYTEDEWALSRDDEDHIKPLWHPSDFCRGPTIGTAASLEKLTLFDLRAHFARFFVGRNMVLSLAGPHSPVDALLAAAPFSALAPGLPNLRQLPPEPKSGAVHGHFIEAHKCEVRLLFPIVGHPPEVAPVWWVLNNLLQGSGHGVLHRALRSTRGLVYSCQSNPTFFSDFATHTVSLDPNPADPITAVSVVVSTLGALKKQPPTSSELNGAKECVLTDFAAESEDLWFHSAERAWSVLYECPLDRKAMIDRVAAVTKEDVLAFCQRLFKTGAGHLIYAGPKQHERAMWKLVKAL